MSIYINGVEQVGGDVSRPRVKMVGKTLTGQAQYTTIQAAINAAAADPTPPSATAPYTIEIFPGIYNEAITCSTYVNLKGIGPKGAVFIQQTDATIITLATQVQIENLTVRLGTPSVARNMIIDNGAACVSLFVNIIFEITTPGGWACGVIYTTAVSSLTLERCRYSLGNIGSGRAIYTSIIGATSLTLVNCDFAITSVSACHVRLSQANTLNSTGSRYSGTCQLLVTTSPATIARFSNDAILCTTASTIATSSSVTIKSRPQQYEVYAGMLIQHAIAAAAADTPAPSATAPYTILIHPGIYTEAVICSNYVNLKGIGPKGAVVIQQTDATIITLATQVQIENLTVRLVTPSAARNLITDSAACICKFTDMIVAVTTPGVFLCNLWYCNNAASSYTFERCSCNVTYAQAVVYNDNTGTMKIIDCDFTNSGSAKYVLRSTDASNWSIIGSYLIGASDGTAIQAVTGNLTIDSSVISYSLYVGTGTVIARNCSINGLISTNSATSKLRLSNCIYRAVTRSSGNIVDESPQSLDSIYHLAKYEGDVLIASANIATRTSVGTVSDGGNGQCVLHNAAAGYAGIENPAEAGGGLATTFNPTRTPRFSVQFSSSSFPANSSMFFGLRAALGAAVPAMNEIHAGFRWNGANFIASSSDGAGVGVADNCTTPSVNVQHQLEIIILGGIQVEFYIDGVLVFTHATAAGLPSGEMQWQIISIDAAAQTIDVSVRRMFCQECPS